MKAVIFDMDGVLFDTEKLAVKCWDEIGVKCSLGKVGYMVMKTLGRTREESVKIFEKEFGDKFNNDIFQKEYAAWLSAYYEKNAVPVKEGVYEILSFLKENGYKLAVASSSSESSVMHHLNNADITHFFDKIICGDKVKKSKPEPDIYLTACRALGEKPLDCFAVEDSKSGLLSAQRAGCRVVYIPDLYIAESENEYDIKFNTLTEFKGYIQLPKRKNNRLKNYDYSKQGAYFVTICTKDKRSILSKVKSVGVGVPDDPMVGVPDDPITVLTDLGNIVNNRILEMNSFYDNIKAESYVIMPNHIHILLRIVNGSSGTPTPTNALIPSYISTLKRMTDKESGNKLWQRGYHDHIIRDECDYMLHLQYIEENPKKWLIGQDEYFV